MASRARSSGVIPGHAVIDGEGKTRVLFELIDRRDHLRLKDVPVASPHSLERGCAVESVAKGDGRIVITASRPLGIFATHACDPVIENAETCARNRLERRDMGCLVVPRDSLDDPAPTDETIASVRRELLRAAGSSVWEPVRG
jgi:hypothetical protein